MAIARDSRVVRPELLDGLDPADPEAIRSRKDLRYLNLLMGTSSWIGCQLARQNPATLVEIGAGEGLLSTQLSRRFPKMSITGIDRIARPVALPPVIDWRSQDIFATDFHSDAVVGSMILHHFADDQLLELGARLRHARVLCFCEPWRHNYSRALGVLTSPFWGRITRHDLPVSVNAGFIPGELPYFLGLSRWHVEESVDWRGSTRLLAWRE